MTYIVMEVKTSYVVILDEDGKFYYAANMNYHVGDKIEKPFILNIEDKKENKSLLNYIYKLTPIALVVCLVFGLNVYNNSVLASFILKINPEVEIIIDHRNRVKDIVANNNDGFYLIQDYDHQQKDYKVVTEELVNRALELGYLDDNGNISIKMLTKGMEDLSNELNVTLDNSLKDDYNITIYMYDYDDELDDFDDDNDNDDLDELDDKDDQDDNDLDDKDDMDDEDDIFNDLEDLDDGDDELNDIEEDDNDDNDEEDN